MPLRWRSVAAAATVAALTAGCGLTRVEVVAGPDRSPAARPSDADGRFDPQQADFDAVRRLLATQSRAVAHRDRTAYLATVDPSFTKAAGTFYDNVVALGATSVTYSVGNYGVEPAAVPGADAVFSPAITEHLDIAGATTAPVANVVAMTFVRRGTRWLLAKETVSDDEDAYDHPQWRPWFGAPIAVAQVGRVIAMTDRDSDVSAATVAANMAGDLASDAAVLCVPTVPVLVDATTNSSAVLINYATGEEAGASERTVVGRHGVDGNWGPAAALVIQANPKHVEQLLTDAQTDRHELTHALLSTEDAGLPTWVVEGIAEYVGTYPGEIGFNDLGVGRRRLLAVPHRIPTEGLFDADAGASYAISHEAVHWLVATYGMARFRTFMAAYRGIQGPIDDATPVALRRTYGIGLAQLVAGTWQEIATLPA